MLEDVAVYLIVAPLATSLGLGVLLAAWWLAGRRPAPARVRVRPRR